ncbi:MAG: MTH938/NDUFAF3 family protein [Candidatus Hermodarchaeota archaeon]
MNFEKTDFGTITIDGKRYDHDIYLFVNGTIQKRDKHNSPRIGGHRSLSKWELDQVLKDDPEILIIGMGQSGVLPFTDDAELTLESLINEKSVKIIKGITPEILSKTNDVLNSGKRVAGVFHTTC